MTGWQEWFEGLWTHREERIYRERFGDLGERIYPTPERVYTEHFRQPDIHPGWLHHGVFACPPGPARPTWIYVTSGLSNPWNLEAPGRDPSGLSGLGFELVLELVEESSWAIGLLWNLMAYQLLVAIGRYPGAALLEYGNRVPLGAPIRPQPRSALTWLLVLRPEHYAPSFELPSGRVDFFHLVGITEAEAALVKERGNEAVLAELRRSTPWPATDPDRR